MSTIYYGHHQYKYGSKVEDYELELIKRTFPDAQIINPPVDIDQNRSEKAVMEDCVNHVCDCDIFVFSSLLGIIGKGLYTELMTALNKDKPIYYLDYGTTKKVIDFDTRIINHGEKPREYAYINVITQQ